MDVFLVKPVRMTQLLAAVGGRDLTVRQVPLNQDRDLKILRRLRTLFAEEASRLVAEIKQAAEAKDRRWLRSRAHYAKNSADVAGYQEISLLSAKLEQAAKSIDAPYDDIVKELTELMAAHKEPRQ